MQKSKVEMVNAGHNYIGDIVDSDLKKLVEEKNYKQHQIFLLLKT